MTIIRERLEEAMASKKTDIKSFIWKGRKQEINGEIVQEEIRLGLRQLFDENAVKTIFEIAHRQPSNTVFWHLDGALIGTTRDIHQLGLNPTKGKHMLSLSDNTGETLNIPFEVVSEKK